MPRGETGRNRQFARGIVGREVGRKQQEAPPLDRDWEHRGSALDDSQPFHSHSDATRVEHAVRVDQSMDDEVANDGHGGGNGRSPRAAPVQLFRDEDERHRSRQRRDEFLGCHAKRRGQRDTDQVDRSLVGAECAQ